MSDPIAPPLGHETTEMAVLGCGIVKGEEVETMLARGICEDDFSAPANREVFRTMRRLHKADPGSVDIVTLTHHLKIGGELDEIGGEPVLHQMMDLVTYPGKMGAYCDLLIAARNGTGGSGLPDAVCAATWLPEALHPPDPLILDTLDAGSKCPVIGPSKAKKTFFLLQLAVSLAAGLSDFLGWRIPRARQVLFCNLEVTPYHAHRRLAFICHALGLDPAALDPLHVWNLRGHHIGVQQLGAIRQKVATIGAEVVMFDPLYKLHQGDENKAQDVKPVLQMFDDLCEDTGATVVYSHHDAKGVVAERQTIDRGAGSNVLARDYDTAIYLADHKKDGLLVAQTILRAYPPQDAVSIYWEDGAFYLSDEPPALRPRNQTGQLGAAPTEEDALKLLAAGPVPKTEYQDKLQDLGLTERKARAMRNDLLDDGTIAEHKERKFHGKTWVGLPEDIAAKKEHDGRESEA